MKQCKRCHELKCESEFRARTKKNPSGGLYHYTNSLCNLCEREYQKEHRNAEYHKAYKIIKKVKDPVKFHMQERISQWRNKDAESDLTVDYLTSLWESQKGLCYYTQRPMTLGGNKQTIWESASLDRLDPNLGYRQGNLVWCLYKVNTMKGNMTEKDFKALCQLIVNTI